MSVCVCVYCMYGSFLNIEFELYTRVCLLSILFLFIAYVYIVIVYVLVVLFFALFCFMLKIKPSITNLTSCVFMGI